MTKHHGGRSRTRSIFRKKVRDRGMRGITRFLVKYELGDKVDIIADPAYQKRGFPHKRFFGKTGTIVGKRGRCFIVDVKDQNKMKTLLIGKEHIRMNKYHADLKQKA
ncbi:MAG: 50S ribosomal protein L21e [Promethearchaeota archaeon]